MKGNDSDTDTKARRTISLPTALPILHQLLQCGKEEEKHSLFDVIRKVISALESGCFCFIAFSSRVARAPIGHLTRKVENAATSTSKKEEKTLRVEGLVLFQKLASVKAFKIFDSRREKGTFRVYRTSLSISFLSPFLQRWIKQGGSFRAVSVHSVRDEV